jgi:hypothetical protein
MGEGTQGSQDGAVQEEDMSSKKIPFHGPEVYLEVYGALLKS